MPDLTAVVIQLQPTANFSYDNAKLLHRWFFQRLEKYAPTLLHADDPQQRLFTLASFTHEPLPYIRMTALRADASEYLNTLLADLSDTVKLGDITFPIYAKIYASDKHSDAGQADYAQLIAQVRCQKLYKPLIFRIVSPTNFRKNAVDNPLPLPNLFFGSLLRRWKRITGETMLLPLRDFIEEHVHLASYNLHTTRRNVPKSMVGFIGNVRFRVNAPHKNISREAFLSLQHQAQMITILSHYAFYAGVGTKTTYGMGQVRLGKAHV